MRQAKEKGHEMTEEGFRIDTPEKAGWALQKYAGMAKRREQNNVLAAQENERVRLWLEQANATVDSSMEFYRGHLEVFALKQRLAGVKTFDSPSGKIKSRETSVTFEVDKTVFTEWAQANNRDELLRFTIAPDLATIKKTMIGTPMGAVDPATGEEVPGLIPVPSRIAFTIEPNMDMAELGDDEDE